MDRLDEREYWVPEHVRGYLSSLGFHLPIEAMEEYIRSWHSWMGATGDFYNYRDRDGFGRVYEVHRRSIHPAMRVCNEWGSLLLNDKTQVVCESQECTDWLEDFFKETGFMPAAQNAVVRAFGMGTGAWALWIDADARKVRIRHYDARMVIPLSWDEEGVTECAFVTRAFYRGRAVDQLQMHVLGVLGDGDGSRDGLPPAPSTPSHGNRAAPSPSQSPAPTYRIVTVCFDDVGAVVEPAGACGEYDTGCTEPATQGTVLCVPGRPLVSEAPTQRTVPCVLLARCQEHSVRVRLRHRQRGGHRQGEVL